MSVAPPLKHVSRPIGGLVTVQLAAFPSQGFQHGQSEMGLKSLHSQQVSRVTLRLLSPRTCGGTLLKNSSCKLLGDIFF